MLDLHTIHQVMREAHSNSWKHGFWDDLPFGPTGDIDPAERAIYYSAKLALVHSEISEALEELRKNNDPHHVYVREEDGKPEGFGYELADAVIRIADLAEFLHIDLKRLISEKATFNATRPAKHGKGF